MKVLHLITSLNPGGIERWVLTMLENVPRSECQLDICCKGLRTGKWQPIIEDLGAKVIRNPLTPEHLLFGIRLSRSLVENAYDILHVHVGAFSGFPVWIAKQKNVKTICSFHSNDYGAETGLLKLPGISRLRDMYGHFSLKYAIRRCDHLVCVSKAVLETIASYDDSAYSKSEVILHGTRIPEKKTEQEERKFRKSLNWEPGTPLVVSVGRFEARKNPAAIIDCYQEVLKQVDAVRLVWVGDGPLRKLMEGRVKELRLEDKIAFLGFRDDALQIMSLCDVFIIPSISEGFGIAAIEASAAGLPVVGSRVPGLTEAVEDGRTGLLFESHDISGMAKAIVRLLSNIDFADKMGEAGKERVREHFSVQAMVNSYMKLYSRCLTEQVQNPVPGSSR